jgi:prepilin-type N-terminal cleavage/methylation domain-containing protein
MLVQSVTMPANRSRARSGFTFLEVLACLLVVGLGLASVVAMVYFGIVNSQKAMAGSTAMITAMSVAVDPRPYLSPDVAPAWNVAPRYSFDDTTSPSLTQKTQGYINGYLVVRNESTTPADVIASDGGLVYARSVLVKVDVYALLNGAIVASYNTRFVRQRNTP